ncbi:methylenetetrahydrofolate reductase C-terminal domain-containing protein [Acinetobacter sp. CFCC 10889]|uniref:methylenetetrahydrofolate reductase C-terminal domain-containing protein n=1 Tax=Acinetobacter sp. CFCC 10889 TaxID=1775557 RepID=UPI000DD0A5E1|nr:methylenetetrahydrofolate reductase C-terminal domain-containing protein [Acinetobacter sp. CFCC 10889]
MSHLSQYLAQNQFCVLIEYLTSSQKIFSVPNQLAGFPVCMTLADRVHSDTDLSPLDAAALYPKDIEKVLHFAGKGRDIADFERFLLDAKNSKQHNLLLLTGDKLKNHHFGDDQQPRTRYLESVNAVIAAKQHGNFYIGVAFNPFKYVEAEQDAQYFKLCKKLKAGADFIITQLGYDIVALQQVKNFLTEQAATQKILACVMPLTLARANFMLKHQVAGIVITPHMLQVLQDEKAAGLTEQVYARCALQILLCKHLGFAGVHLSACHQTEEQTRLQHYIEEYKALDFAACLSLWNHLWQVQTGQEFYPKLVQYSRPVSSKQILKYQHLSFMHDAFFASKMAKSFGHFIFKSSFWDKTTTSQALLKSEFVSKHRIVGCESCGQCRLGKTLYICPETCPKGLANGPCGGTTLDRCEFGDRECIHSVKARLAKAVQQTEILKTELIPTVPFEIRGSSSWKNWFRDEADWG